MTKQKSTKRALLLSALSLLMCVSMLIGSTFAWFTDSVTSGSNKIVAGTLDVQLLMYDGSDYADISDSSNPIFGKGSIAQNNNAETLWEPGKTQVAYLAIKNNGNLALKYKVVLDVENVSKNLYEVMEYAIIPDAMNGSVTSWTDGNSVVEGMQNVSSDVSLAVGVTHYFALAIHMNEEAGNEYQGGEVNFDLTVLATQDTVESDSFDNQYDVNAGYVFKVSSFEELRAALANGGNIELTKDVYVPEILDVSASATIYGQGHTIFRADGYTGTVFSVKADSNLTIENITLDGSGATATGNLIATECNGSIILNDGAVLQNNVGAHAVSLATRGGGSLTLNGAQIINNSSDSGAIWGGGAIIVNEGSKINGNSSTGSAGAIRMVGDCSLTVNGGEISNNTAAGDGGAIWGYGSSTYNFNGGVIANNKADGSGGAIWTGDGSVVNISGDFEFSNNTASEAGALRLSNRTVFNMTGGKVSGNVSVNSDENDGFYGWNPAVNITGGELSDNILIQGGLTPTVGGNGITGIVNFDLTTNHYNINLANEFGTIKFTVNENDEHFINCNFKPADGYTYTEGDEAKLICMNEGYSTYWNVSTGTFCLQADN